MSPTPPALPAGTTLGHSYEYGLDVNLGTTESPVWQPVRRISDFQPTPTSRTQSAATYDDFGADNADVVGWNTNLTFTVQGNRSTATGLYLPELEAILARTRPEAKGEAAVIEARWYHKPESGAANPNDAGQGFFTVSAPRANTGADGAVEVRTVTFTGKGSARSIANPFTGWAATAPKLGTVTPTGLGTGKLVTLTGSGFTGATDVKFGTPSATAFTVIGDATIVAVLPSGSAGSVQVTVITPAGTSTAVAYTRAA